MFELTVNFSKGLHELDLMPGDRVGVYVKQHPKAIPVILGTDNAGLQDMPKDLSSTEEARKIIEHSDPNIVIVENRAVLEMVQPHYPKDRIFSIEPIDGIRSVDEIFAMGAKSHATIPKVDENDIASIIYTSGTTGEPKGVMLTHGNYMSNYESVQRRIPLSSNDKFVSAMPIFHVYPRAVIMDALILGAETYGIINLKTAPEEIKLESPTVFPSVPRVWDNSKKRFNEVIRERGAHFKELLKKAHIDLEKYMHGETDPKKFAEIGINLDIQNMLSGNHSFKAWMIHEALDKVIYSSIRENYGGRLRDVISGGSAMSEHLILFYMISGFNFYQGYGLTETAPILAGGLQDVHNLSAVGPPLDNVLLDIRDNSGHRCMPGIDGKIFAKGPNIMLGYYKNPELTSQTIENGWLDTGDIGNLINNILTITGREYDDFKLGNGEKVHPREYESLAEDYEEIEAAVLVGKDWKSPAMLIYPNMSELKFMARRLGIRYNEESELLLDPRIQTVYKWIIDKINDRKEIRYKIHDFRLIPEIIITPTQKVQRGKLLEKYSAEISELSEAINK
jgi:long-chain acyl-CoA synthetase